MLAAGGKFGDYDVVRELGRGGMGAVYLVRDPETGGELAAKVMFDELSVRDDSYKQRFIREAEIAMAAEHPNLLKVYEVGRDPETGLAYMIMDYADGGSLHEKIAERLADNRGPYSVKEAMAVVRPLLSALVEAERLGVVHRDIKPDNILFDADGTPKLADLGIAKVSEGESSTLLTMSDVVIGTPAYMAPEQLLDSHHVDARADLYSLGCVLWEMLVGERPNADLDSGEQLARAVKGVRIPDIRAYRKKLPPRIVEFIRRMTAPKPERRFPSAASALRFLDEWRLRQERMFRRFLVGMAFFLTVTLALVLAFGLRWIHAPDAPKSARSTAEEATDEVLGEFSVPLSVD